MGNESLYRRLLEGFREAESTFSSAVALALTEQRWTDALRRSHDMKGLAGTIGAQRLFAAAQDLHVALTDRNTEPALEELRRATTELERVLADIDSLLAAAV